MHLFKFVMINPQMSVMPDPFPPVVFDNLVIIHLPMQVYLFMVRGIFKTQFVVTITLVGVAFGSASRLVQRQAVRRHIAFVVGAPGDHGLVRVAFKEADNDFVANPGMATAPQRRPAHCCETRTQQELFSFCWL